MSETGEQVASARWQRWKRALRVVARVVGALPGAYFGVLSSFLYAGGFPYRSNVGDAEAVFGMIVGFVTGLLAGTIWSWRVESRFDVVVREGDRAPGGPFSMGLAWGVAVGVGSALVVHVTLMIFCRKFEPLGLGIGSIFGTFVGLMAGLLLSLVYTAAAIGCYRRGRRQG